MKNTIIAIVAIVIIGLAVMLSLGKGTPNKVTTPAYQPPENTAPQAQAVPEPADKTTDIQSDLNKIDTGDLNKEFQTIDENIKGL